MKVGRLIELHCPADSWRANVSEGHPLLDCLQFADKAQIVARHERLRQFTRFDSRRQIEEAGKRLEKLRNDLAHSQDIVANDWDTDLDSVLDGPPGMSNGKS